MKVGEYVRTPKGIGRINQMYSDRKDSYIYLDCGITIDYITKDFTEEEINKMYPSSPNIIDLTEEGDYVNGFKVLRIDKECNLYPKTLKCQYPNNIDYFDIFNEDIKSILTKEAFENMEYKIGE